MKRLHLLLLLLCWITFAKGQNVGIGTNTPVPSAQLEVRSTTKGLLPPRMTYAQRNAILNPVAGLVIWCSDCDELQVFNGTIWKNMSGVAASGPTLPGVTICNQVWMVKNLDVRTYRNGEIIPEVKDQAVWNNLTIGAWCWYNNDSATYAAKYGRLYNWYAVNDPRGLAPQGWHIPSSDEWDNLVICLGAREIAGGKMKETGTINWQNPNVGATNSSGFTGLPGGLRVNGLFNNIGRFGVFWNATEYSATHAWYDYLSTNSANALKASNGNKHDGYSVRCIRD